MDFKSASKTLILALASSTFALTALAQWQWIDKDGRKVFSDRAPSIDIPQKNILKQPHGAAAAQVASDAGAETQPPATSAPASKASTPKLSGKDTELEARKKQAENEATAKKKADEETLLKAKAESCERAQKSLATLQSGVRIGTTNAKGEREIMDDAARMVETKRIQGIIQNDCKN